MVDEKKIKIPTGTIYIDDKGILILDVNENADIDLAEVKLAFKTYSDLGVNPSNKILQLIISPANASISPDARKYVSERGRNYFKASAIVSDSLPIRLLVNFFNQFYKHEVPFKMFASEEQARIWLEKHY
jgi:hypothetical protein